MSQDRQPRQDPADELMPGETSTAAEPDQSDEGFVRDVLRTELDDATLDMVSNLTSEEWVKANLTNAEVHEQKWLARTIIQEIKAMHPSQDSIWQGDIRQYAAGDESDALESLNEAQRTTLYQLILAHIARLTRSRDMEQQEILRTIINRNERRDLTEDDDGGWL